MFVPNFKILAPVVPEKPSMEKKVYTHTHTKTVMEKTKTTYPHKLCIPVGGGGGGGGIINTQNVCFYREIRKCQYLFFSETW